MTYKKFVFLSILIPLPIIFSLGILLYIYDPLRLYHEPWFRDDTYYYGKLLQNKSFIDNNSFNSIIIGNSYLENASPKQANKILNTEGSMWINLSSGGSSHNQRYSIIKYVIKNKNIKNIITLFDGINSSTLDTNYNHNILYDNNPFNDFQIYINKKFIICALLFSKSQKCVGNTKDELYSGWIYDKKAKRLFGGIENWLKYFKGNAEIAIKTIIKKSQEKEINKVVSDISDKYFYKKYINKFIFSYAKEYKNINFYIIIPTYSRLHYKLNYKNNYFYKWKKMIIYLVNESQKYPNVKIYGFDDLDYADNIANYKDLTHYNVDMNEMQLDAIKNNTHILTTENIDEYFKIMEEKIISYDLQPIIEKINKNK